MLAAVQRFEQPLARRRAPCVLNCACNGSNCLAMLSRHVGHERSTGPAKAAVSYLLATSADCSSNSPPIAVMGGLSIVTGSAATLTAAGTYLLRHHLPAPAVAALIHAAISGFIVSIASSDALYAKTPWILGKDRTSGRFRKGSRVAILPFHALLHLRLAIRRSKSKEPLIQEVANGWYIGGWPYTEAALPKGDLSVVDCTSEYPRTFDRPYICLPTWDTQGVSANDVKRGVDFALQQRRLGRAVLVHCAHGHGRSAQVLIASMVMAGDAANIDAALAQLQATRPKCKLNRLQRSNLEDYLSSVDPPKH